MLHYVQQLVANFVCLPFGAEQVVYCELKTAACCVWKQGSWLWLLEIFFTCMDAPSVILRGPPPGCHSGLHSLIPVTHQIYHQICFLPPQKHLQTPAITHTHPHQCLHHLPFGLLQTGPGYPAKPWRGSSICRTQLPGFSLAPSRGSTSPPSSSTFMGSQSSPVSPTKSSSTPTNPSMPLPALA